MPLAVLSESRVSVPRRNNEIQMVIRHYPYLVGGFNPSENYYSVGMILPNIWKITNVPNYQPVIIPLQKNIHLGYTHFRHTKKCRFPGQGAPQIIQVRLQKHIETTIL
jgi:hypothetical protein